MKTTEELIKEGDEDFEIDIATRSRGEFYGDGTFGDWCLDNWPDIREHLQEGEKKARFITENWTERLRGLLSREVRYRIIVDGELGQKEIGKLIALLQAHQKVLEEEESTV